MRPCGSALVLSSSLSVAAVVASTAALKPRLWLSQRATAAEAAGTRLEAATAVDAAAPCMTCTAAATATARAKAAESRVTPADGDVTANVARDAEAAAAANAAYRVEVADGRAATPAASCQRLRGGQFETPAASSRGGVCRGEGCRRRRGAATFRVGGVHSLAEGC